MSEMQAYRPSLHPEGIDTALNVLSGSALGKAVTYAKKQKKYMENYLLDGRCALSNNAA
ncbi:IS66 family transposase, partial [Klebsiella pneumoniae]|uniref:IS66 family transposase n=1 Tax=Klebsiella pneumoniae TaxID=573 RepID=UPI003390536C